MEKTSQGRVGRETEKNKRNRTNAQVSGSCADAVGTDKWRGSARCRWNWNRRTESCGIAQVRRAMQWRNAVPGSKGKTSARECRAISQRGRAQWRSAWRSWGPKMDNVEATHGKKQERRDPSRNTGGPRPSITAHRSNIHHGRPQRTPSFATMEAAHALHEEHARHFSWRWIPKCNQARNRTSLWWRKQRRARHGTHLQGQDRRRRPASPETKTRTALQWYTARSVTAYREKKLKEGHSRTTKDSNHWNDSMELCNADETLRSTTVSIKKKNHRPRQCRLRFKTTFKKF